MINFSDDSENDDDDEFMMPLTPKSSKGTSPGPLSATLPPTDSSPRRHTVSAHLPWDVHSRSTCS